MTAQKQATTTLPTEQEQLAWLRLTRTKSIGPKTFDQLLTLHGTAQNALEMLPEMAKNGGRKTPFTPCSSTDAEKEIAAITAHGAQLITKIDPRYPSLLTHIHDAPSVITVKGNIDLLNRTSIAFVGARNASINGKKLTSSITRELGKQDYVITSGLARGIDTAAHLGALETGTIAVIAGGIDVIYPKENAALHEKIAQDGLLIAELAFGTGLRAEQFPRRNRIVAGLSHGVVVVEAAQRSGSLITARQALEQGREVMAFPGSPLDPRAAGPNSLIQQGAHLVTNAQDIISAITAPTLSQRSLFEATNNGFQTSSHITLPTDQMTELRQNIRQHLGYTPVSIDDLVLEYRTSINAILTCLLELELAGRLTRHAGNKVSLIMEDD